MPTLELAKILLKGLQYLPTLLRLVPTVVQAVHDVMQYVNGADCKLPPEAKKQAVAGRKAQLDRAIKSAAEGDHGLLSLIHSRAKL